MDERVRVAGLHRRFGFGLRSGEIEAAIDRGGAAEAERLLYPDRHGAVVAPDPFGGLGDLSFQAGKNRQVTAAAMDAWLTRMATTAWPLHERVAWFWHGLLVSSVAKVKSTQAMVEQIRLFWTRGLGPFAEMLEAVAVDPAMLIYLDGKDSTAQAPNENFSRELLELFALGVGHYTEADVQAGARALTGWTVRLRQDGAAAFVARRHDDRPQSYLGVAGVHDVASVIAVVTNHAAVPEHIAGQYGRSVLGPGVSPEVVGALAHSFAEARLDLRSLVGAALQHYLAGVETTPIVLGPVPWLVMAQRATGAALRPGVRLAGLRAAGQVPLLPPSVAGWPGGEAWYGAATMVARLNLALAVAQATPPTSVALAAAKHSDWASLALALGLPRDFGPDTVRGLAVASDAYQRLALALVSPEFVEV